MKENNYILFNINNYVKVRLTFFGKQILAKYWGGGIPEFYKTYTDQDGYIKFQLHELMNIFGKYTYNGCSNLPFETNIFINSNGNS